MRGSSLLGVLLCACGGVTAVDRPSGGEPVDASAPPEPPADATDWRDVRTISDGSHWDRTVWHDAWSYPTDAAYEEVDGGKDCEFPPGHIPLELGEGINCCNGEACRGRCLLFAGWERPVCACSLLIGGCASPRVCCNHRCTTNVTCGLL